MFPDHKDETTDINHLTIHVLTMVSIIGFFVWITYLGTNERAEVRSRLSGIEKSVNDLKAKMNEDFVWTRDDHSVFCLKAQLLNKDWICPDVDSSYKGFRMNQLSDTDIIKEIDNLEKKTSTKSFTK